jgi:MATE family multidrug resistance protein
MADKSTLLSESRIEEESSLRYMLKLAAPMVVTTISSTIMQFVDRYMVSWLGTEALAAILPAGLASFLPSAFAVGAMASLNTFVSQSLGRVDKKSCSNYFWQTIYIGLAYFLLVVVVMWPTAPWIFKLMGQPEAVADMEVIYFRIILYAHILAVINWSANQFFMGIHRPSITMYASLCGQIANVVANYVLIFGKLGFPAMGIAGAGWGTFIGIAVAAVINMAVFLSSGMNTAFRTRRTLHLDFSRMYDLLKVGLPAGFGLMVNVALWGMILFALVGRFGTEALAATSAVLSYTSLTVMPVVGIETALAAAVGKTIGAGRKDLSTRQTRVCLRVALIYMGLVGLCFLAFRNALMVFWSSNEEVNKIGVNLLICAAIYQVFHAAHIIYGGALRGAGDTLWLAIISAVGAVVILGLGGLLIVNLFGELEALGPWIVATISIIAVGLANYWRFKSNRWMKIDLFKRRPVSVPVETGTVVE